MASVDEDQDAEVAEELDEEMETEQVDAELEPEDDGSDADAEIAEDDDDDDEGEVVGAVKSRATRARSRRTQDEESEVEEEDVGEDGSDGDSSESGAEENWEAADDAGDDLEVPNAGGSRCVSVYLPIHSRTLLIYSRFCDQDEEHDPSEEYEEYLACAVCGDNGKCSSSMCIKNEEKHARGSNINYKIRVQALTSVPAAHRQCAREAGSLSSEEGT
jgi:histone acetyltransferase SAS3